MPRGLYIALHACAAAAFIFWLQRYGLKQSVETASLWSFVLGAGAAMLAWRQTRR